MKKNPLAIVLALSAFFFVVFVIVAIGTVMTLTPGRSQKKFFGRSNSIGVLELKGIILDSKKLLDDMDTFAEDPTIKGVVLRINSPGGAVAPSQELFDGVRRLAKKKPVFASMGSLAASGGYYVAVGTKKIFANPGTITGSIGVIMQFADLSKLYQWAKVNPYNVKTGRYKDIGSPAREMTPEEKALLQGMIDNVLGQFRRAVATGRNLSLDRVVEVSDGRIFSGEQAKAAKLVDELGGFNDAVEAMAKEVGITGKPSLVYIKKKRPFERLFSDLDDEDSESSSLGSGVATRVVADAIRALVRDGFGAAAKGSAANWLGPFFVLPYAVE